MNSIKSYINAKKYVETHAIPTNKENSHSKNKNPAPCLTISAQSGIDTDMLCTKLVASLGGYYSTDWAYFDKDLIRKVIRDHDLPPNVRKYLCEEKESTFSQMMNEFLGVHPPRLEMMHKLMNTIINLAKIGNVILVGRGSNVVTSHLNNVFHIRLVAPLEARIMNLQKSKGIEKQWAEKILLKEDENRKLFLFKTFHKNINDPLLYHLIINVSKISPNELVANIVDFIKNQYPNNKEKASEIRQLLSKQEVI